MQSKEELIKRVIWLVKTYCDAGSTKMNLRWKRAIIAGWNPPEWICEEQNPYNPTPFPFPLTSWELEPALSRMSVEKIRGIADAVGSHDYGAKDAEHDALANYVTSVIAQVEGARDFVLQNGHELAGMNPVEGGWVPHRNFFVAISLPFTLLRRIAREYREAYPQTLVVPPVKELHLPQAKSAHEARPYGFFRALAGKEAISFMEKCVTDALAAYEGEWKCINILPNGNKGFTAHVHSGKSLLHEIKVTV